MNDNFISEQDFLNMYSDIIESGQDLLAFKCPQASWYFLDVNLDGAPDDKDVAQIRTWENKYGKNPTNIDRWEATKASIDLMRYQYQAHWSYTDYAEEEMLYIWDGGAGVFETINCKDGKLSK